MLNPLASLRHRLLDQRNRATAVAHLQSKPAASPLDPRRLTSLPPSSLVLPRPCRLLPRLTSCNCHAVNGKGKACFKGVRPRPSDQFGVEFQQGGRRYWLGTFLTSDIAARAYDVAMWKLGLPHELNFS
ncbi:AP2-containing protein [Hordeum vulgare]|nr:AP2-containing protein [Hordeum vulgare]